MFKSYTRKSSAVVGAKRAGLTDAVVVQHEGNWGFFEPGTSAPAGFTTDCDGSIVPGSVYDDFYEIESAEFALAETAPDAIQNALNAVMVAANTKFTHCRNDRRKILRCVNRGISEVHKMNKKLDCPNEAVLGTLLRAARNLRNGYKASCTPRIIFA